MPTALLSAFRKDDAFAKFSEGLFAQGWGLFASGGTHDFLQNKGLTVDNVTDLVGPPILGHRVVTLAREIYAALLARRDNAEDMAELKRIHVEPIDLVYVNLYPLVDAMADPKRTYDSVLNSIDIGGPTLLRAAAKGGRLAVSSPRQFADVLEFVREYDPGTWDPFIAKLAAEAERTVAEYLDYAIEFYTLVGDDTFK